ncbi:hypothetical protein [Xenorhabdus vietnamensis]|nr:hypothetical protein [Xenorhabdus vietnamensis]
MLNQIWIIGQYTRMLASNSHNHGGKLSEDTLSLQIQMDMVRD